MAPDHARLRRLILDREDLEGNERAEADAHLQQCPGCRRLLIVTALAQVRQTHDLLFDSATDERPPFLVNPPASLF